MPLFPGSRRSKLTRRTFMGTATLASLMPHGILAKERDATTSGQRLWYRQPAARWEEALPLGNGRLGCMVFGRVAQERLQLNEDTLWAGAPYKPDSPEALEALPELRRLIAEGRYEQAAELASARFMARPLIQMPYGTLGDLLLDFPGAAPPTMYERSLDLGTAIATTRYDTPNGRFSREAFASAPDQLFVLRLEGPPAAIDFDLAYRGPRKVEYTPANYSGAATDLVDQTATDWMLREAAGPANATVQLADDGPACLLITGRNEPGPGVPAGLRYALRVRVVSDGQIEVHPGGIRVRNAGAATLLVAAATSFVNFADVSGDPVALVRRRTDAGAARLYKSLRRNHVREYQSLFGGFSVDLGQTESVRQPTDERIANAETASDPALVALYLQYARYLLLSSSRPGTQPANLQGIWNEGVNPPWGSKYTININTEMNYWPADPAGLGLCVEPLLRMVEELSVTGARTANTMYGARGWVAHHNTDLWRAAAPIDGPQWGLWPCGGAWLCNTLWDHWDYIRDDALLGRLYPLLKGASLFFLDTLIEDPAGRGLVTSPSVSPENQHPFGSSVCAGPAMDRQILRDLFARTIDAGTRLERDPALRSELARARERLAPDAIGGQGQLQEWIEDWDAQAPEQDHRHVSHLYAVYPSNQINVRDTPALLEAAKVSLNKRGDFATGWGTAWRLCLWARLGDGERAHAILKSLLGPQRTYPNMFDAHPPFQIDGNFGGAAGIMEMLLQSWGGELIVLPALPAAWPTGKASGLRARGGLTADLEWRDGKLTALLVKGPPGEAVRVRRDGNLIDARLDRSGFYRFRA
jgi:alpha-L-fucosidase 2